MDLTVGTFNLNNLFDRFNFATDLGSLPIRDRRVRTTYQWSYTGRGTAPGDPPPQLDEEASSTPIVRIQKDANGTLLTAKPLAAQQSIAGRISAIGLDVLAVQEVENIDALRRFNRDLLDDPYPFEVLLEGNDPRFIDVAVLSRYPVANATSHRFEMHPEDPNPIFGRDLLQLDVLNLDRRRRFLTLFVNHLKSKFIRWNDPDPDRARRNNVLKRQRQAATVARIVDARTRAGSRFVVLGDMNDSPDSAPLEPMITRLELVDGLADVTENNPPPPSRNPEDVPSHGRWTHRFPRSKAPDSFELLDQIWLSPRLADNLESATIDRRVAWNATSRGVGSDHDPVWVSLRRL